MRTPKVVNSFVCCDGLIVVREYSDGICRNIFDQNWQVKRQWINAVVGKGHWTEMLTGAGVINAIGFAHHMPTTFTVPVPNYKMR